LKDSKPRITGNRHVLPFEKLLDREFERLSLWLVQREGYPHAEHYGVSGDDGGRDIFDRSSGTVFQAKNVARFAAADAKKEIEKIKKCRHVDVRRIVFIVRCNVTADSRDAAVDFCAPVPCDFWISTELDEKVKRHPDILGEFFDYGSPAGAASTQDSENSNALKKSVPKLGEITVDKSGVVCEGITQLGSLITDLILHFQQSNTIANISVRLLESEQIDAKLKANKFNSNLDRRKLAERMYYAQWLTSRIERGIRLVAIAGRHILPDPDDLAKCAERVIQKLMELADFIPEPKELPGYTVDVFTEGQFPRHMMMQLTYDDLNAIDARKGERGVYPMSLQIPCSCAYLPYEIQRFRAFPLFVVATVWYEAFPDNDELAATSCHFDYWSFGLS
jgi:hypothetical protein